MTGLVREPTKLIFESNELQATGERCFKVSGTSTNPKVSDC